MKPSGPSTHTASAAWANHTPGLGPRPERRPRTYFASLAILLLVVFVPATAKPDHERPGDLRRLGQSPAGGHCPAGHYLSEENGLCKPCRDGIDYTSFSNVLASCLPCRVCKKDKVVKSRCTVTRNTECQCKPGTFEDKDSTEICQSCSNCTDGEDEVAPCTPETNRKCVSKTAWASQHNLGLKIGLPVTGLLVVLIVALVVWKTKAWSGWLLFMKRAYPGHDQDPKSASTVHSLLGPQTSSKTSDSHHGTEPDKTESLPTGRKLLVPANGNDPAADLKLIFEYCSNEVPFNSWDRLMRQMGLTNNQIQVVRAETLAPRDVLYQMLLKWFHQTGLSASINHLLDALEAMGERCALEKIENYAVKSGKFIYQNATAQAGVVTQETEPGGSL